ncbi:Protein of uncharacterised function (DUF3853) [Chryseobacterium taklimakanense]|uniref:Protein of uncharacterized function (DUF3853) n=1 Tax=Chryseobacterium taklimakanense TaxID=536441 RepID=A0A239XW86_9FLAO|nr:DUF3853 family protein [Chryseobacterium taklimakanense]SNV51075.1 Protein of uncharacterised function (DUF3853) [Chryseobacterium taklimakanense]
MKGKEDKETKKYLWQLTIDEFKELQREVTKEKTYEYGIKGLAKILGCSRSKAYQIKASGILDDAIIQNGKVIVIDVDKALQLFSENNPTQK